MQWKQIIVLPLIGILLFSNLGMEIHTLYCHCKDQISLTLCDAEKVCNSEDKACCNSVTDGENLCDTKNTIFIKFDCDYLQTFETESDTDLQTLGQHVLVLFEDHNLRQAQLAIVPDSNAPPRVFGQQLLIAYQTFLC